MIKVQGQVPKIIAIGASAGGVQAIIGLVRRLPADLPASVLVVTHRSPSGPSYLPEIIRSNTQMKVAIAETGSRLAPGCCLVSPLGHHLTVTPDLDVHLFPDGHHRAGNIDLLFHSLARSAGPRTIGIVLSGNLRDGTSGLKAIKQAGGMAMVQSPAEATFPDMPQNAIQHDGHIDFIAPVAALADEICRQLGREPVEQVEA